ncbi:putative DNA-binding transcriptional regulator YafY [Oxalobacteraceae bacterium GrIS 2.11]
MSQTLLRQFECLKMLSRERKISTTEICQRLENHGHKVSQRTVQRDLQMLSIPFGLESDERDKPFGWKFSSSSTVNLFPGLSETEALSFLMLKQFASRLLPTSIVEDLDPYFKNARRTLSDEVSQSAVRNWPSKVRTVDQNQPVLKPKIAPDVQKQVYAALFRGKQISLSYMASGKQESREFSHANLLGLVERGPILYLVVTLLDYTNVRILALHRVKAARMLESNTKRPANFDLDNYIASDAFGFGADGDGEEIQLEVQFFNNAGAHLLETRLSAEQTEKQIDATTVIISSSVRNTRRLQWWILGFGSDVEVLGPANLREKIRQSLESAGSRYK